MSLCLKLHLWPLPWQLQDGIQLFVWEEFLVSLSYCTLKNIREGDANKVNFLFFIKYEEQVLIEIEKELLSGNNMQAKNREFPRSC
jgi:hypothetical protein